MKNLSNEIIKVLKRRKRCNGKENNIEVPGNLAEASKLEKKVDIYGGLGNSLKTTTKGQKKKN